MKGLLSKLNIKEVNAGACYGPDGWLTDPKGKELISYNPTTGEAIARVVQATPDVYEKVMSNAEAAFAGWRETPARNAAKLCVIWATPCANSKNRWAIW